MSIKKPVHSGVVAKPLTALRESVAKVKEETARVNLEVPLSTRAAWKVLAAQLNWSLTDLVTFAMEREIGRRQRKADRLAAGLPAEDDGPETGRN